MRARYIFRPRSLFSLDVALISAISRPIQPLNTVGKIAICRWHGYRPSMLLTAHVGSRCPCTRLRCHDVPRHVGIHGPTRYQQLLQIKYQPRPESGRKNHPPPLPHLPNHFRHQIIQPCNKLIHKLTTPYHDYNNYKFHSRISCLHKYKIVEYIFPSHES